MTLLCILIYYVFNMLLTAVQLQHNKIIAFGGYDYCLKGYSKALWSNSMELNMKWWRPCPISTNCRVRDCLFSKVKRWR